MTKSLLNTNNTPPLAPKQPKELTHHQHCRIDDYYWMNERDAPDVLQYLKEENDYQEAVMKATEDLQQQLFAEIKAKVKEDDQSVPVFKNQYWYYTRYETGKEYPIYCRKKGSLEAEEEILLNVNLMAEGQAYYHIGDFSVSPDNKILAYSVDQVSRRIYTIYFKNLENGELLPTSISNTTGDMTWANDNQTVFYVVRNKALRAYKVMRHHILDTDSEKDITVFTEKDAKFSVDVDKSKSDQYIFISSESTISEEVRFISADRPLDDFQIFQKRKKDLEYAIEHIGNEFVILTNWKAKNFRLMTTPITQTAMEHWKELLPHRPEVKLEDIDLFDDFLVVEERKDGLNHLRVFDRNNMANNYYLPFEEEVYQLGIGSNPQLDSHLLRFGYTSMTTPVSTFEFNMLTKEKKLLKQQAVLDPNFSPDNYEAKRLWAPAEDGTLIPLSVVYKKGLLLNAENPTLLYGYGSYGYSIDPYFSVSRLSLLDRGFVFAIAHIRGGEELGREWYEDGKLLKKKNTFNDFIACAEHLINSGYTSNKKLIAQGGSAGGLLIGAVANMRPELFKALIAEVPFVDVLTTMLDEDIPLTVGEYDEWGNPNDETYYYYMLSYSPYDNVSAQAYPNMLVTTGYHDSQVQYWEPAKWVAKLRQLKTDQNLLLFKTEMDFGHGGASGRFETLKETAFEYAFMLEVLNKD